MNANERKCFFCFFRTNHGGPVKFSFLLKQKFSGLVTMDCCENRNDNTSPDQYSICVHLRDAHGGVNAAMQRPPWMAEGRATQEQLPGCTRAEQFADSSFIA